MSKYPNRRDLSFNSFDDVIAEANRLLESGYTAKGNWNLSQTCKHLVEWMRFPMDGYPKPPIPLRVIFWCMKVTIARSMAKKILAQGFSPGMATAPDTVFKPDVATEAEAVAALKSTIERLQSHNGAFHPSPLFGTTDRESLEKTQILHCAHHLGYLHPSDAAA